MKICIAVDRIPPEGRGGAERVAWQTARMCAQRGHDVVLITTTARLVEGVEERRVDGVRIFSIHSQYPERWRAWRSLYNPSTVGAVRAILHDFRPDVVHAHNVHYHLSYHLLRLAKQSGARVFLTAHDVMFFQYGKLFEFIDPHNPVCKKDWEYHVTAWKKFKRSTWRYNPFRDSIIRWYLRSVDTLFSVSGALRQALLQNNMPDSTVLYTGIAVDDWAIDAHAVAALQKKFTLQGRRVIFFGGRLSTAKGGQQLLSALREVVRTIPEVLLLVACVPDGYMRSLQQQAREWGIEHNITCTGWLEGDALQAAYHASDVVAVPSICFDSFPLTVLEAMVCEKPVVATCFGGSSESVLDGETGYIVNPYDTARVAERLIELLSDRERCARFGKAGRARAEKLFSLEAHTASLEAYYRNIRNTA